METFITSAGFEPGFPDFQNQHHTDRAEGCNRQFIFSENAIFLTLTTLLTSIFFNRNFSGIFGRVGMLFRALSERSEKLRFCLLTNDRTNIFQSFWFTLFLYNYILFLLLTYYKWYNFTLWFNNIKQS